MPCVVAQPRPHGVAAAVVLDQDRHHVTRGVRHARVVVGDEHAGHARQLLAVGAGQLAAALDLGLEPGEAREQQRRARLVEAVVEAEADDVVAVGLARLPRPRARGHPVRCAASARAPRPRRRRWRAGRPRRRRGSCWRRTRTRRRGPRCRACGRRARALGECAASSISASPCASHSVAQPVDGGGIAGEVHDADRLRARRDAALDVVGVEPEVVRAGDVGEHRRAAAVDDRGGGGGERHGRDDHLVARPDAGGEVGEVQRGRAGGERDRVAARRGARRTRPRTPACAGRASASPTPAPPSTARMSSGSSRRS